MDWPIKSRVLLGGRGYALDVARTLEHMTTLEIMQQHWDRGATLAGAVQGIRERGGAALPPSDRPIHDRNVAAMQEALGQQAFEARLEQGRGTTMEQAIACALGTE